MAAIKKEAYLEKLQEGVKAILEKDSVKEFLKMARMFHTYSFSNTIMIYVQKPNAKRVAGMKTWNKLGRRIKKGEKGIGIFAPAFRSVSKKDNSGIDEEIEKDLNAENVAVNHSKDPKVLTGFVPVFVFDVSQTDGKELPDGYDLKSGEILFSELDPVELYDMLLASSPVPVSEEEIKRPGLKGYYTPLNPKIWLSNSLKPVEKPVVLIHEWAHHEAFQLKLDSLDNSKPKAEVIAEAAAFMVASEYGLDTSMWSFPYLAAWGKDIDKVLFWGKMACRVAETMVEKIETTRTMRQAA